MKITLTNLLMPLMLMFLGASLNLVYAQNDSSKPRIYGNEEAIEFTTMDGQSTDAFAGSILVAENRNKPKSRMIEVKYVRFPATGSKRGAPIIYLSGGPGGSGIQTAKAPNFRFPLFMALRQFADVIALDQRGAGSSNSAPKCVSSYKLPATQAVNEQQVTALYRQAANECVGFWQQQGIDVHGYTTVENAKDIDALRAHLEADKVTLWGISYGSHLALASLKIMADKIDKLVIASAEGLNQTVKLPAQTDAYFDRLQQAINTQPMAAKQFPDLKGLMKRVHQKLERQPVVLKLTQDDGKQTDFWFQKAHLQGVAAAMVADPHRGVQFLLPLYQSLDQGSDVMVKELVKRKFINDDNISFRLMSFAMDVASGITPQRLAIVEQQSKTSLLGQFLNFPMPHLNQVVKGLDLGDEYRSGPKSTVPTLLLSGTLDGRTYIDSQKQATRGLSNLTEVTVINAGHNLFMSSPKVTQVIETFLKGESVTITEIEVDLPSFASKAG